MRRTGTSTSAAIHRHTPAADLPELLRVSEVAAWADCSSGVIYEAVKSHALASVAIGRLVRVPRSALLAWVDGKNGHGGAG